MTDSTRLYSKNSPTIEEAYRDLLEQIKQEEKNPYQFAEDIEADIPIQNKIIRNKIKTWYTNAIEALRGFDE